LLVRLDRRIERDLDRDDAARHRRLDRVGAMGRARFERERAARMQAMTAAVDEGQPIVARATYAQAQCAIAEAGTEPLAFVHGAFDLDMATGDVEHVAPVRSVCGEFETLAAPLEAHHALADMAETPGIGTCPGAVR